MESYGGGGGGTPRPRTAAVSSRRPCAATASRAASGAFVYEGMRATPLSASTANFTRSLRKAVSFAHAHKKPSSAPQPRRAASFKENSGADEADVILASSKPRRSLPEPGAAAARGPWEPPATTRRRRSRSTGGSEDAAGGRVSSVGALREVIAARRKEEPPEKEEDAHRLRVLTGRLLQWRFANARMEKAMARATSAAENKLFYTWLRVAELRNIQAAKRIVAQRRRQKLKLARLLRPQLPLLASWEPLAKPHDDATADLARVLATACINLPLAAGAQADLQSLHEAVLSCVGTVSEIEAITDTFYATASATNSALGELARTIKQEMECLQEATRLSGIVTNLQMRELSLRANLMQTKQRLDLGAAPVPASAGWCF